MKLTLQITPSELKVLFEGEYIPIEPCEVDHFIYQLTEFGEVIDSPKDSPLLVVDYSGKLFLRVHPEYWTVSLRKKTLTTKR